MNHVEGGVHPIAQSGFEKNVDAYERGRPEYPSHVIRDIFVRLQKNNAGALHKILDLACGTGKLTKQLISHVDPTTTTIEALEPASEMRAKFSSLYPDIICREGRADQMPYEDASFDTVFIGQAFHWFANEISLLEIGRVLRPGGWVVLVWNLEDNDVSWVGQLRQQYEQYEQNTPQFRLGLWRKVWEKKKNEKNENGEKGEGGGACELFTALQEEVHNHVLYVTREQTWDRVVSKSYISVLPEAEREALKQKCQQIIQNQFGDSNDLIAYPQKTTVAMAQKL